MSNIKETIRQEIDTRRQHMVEELMGHEENCEYHRIKGMHDAYVDLLTFLDYSLPEEKPSEDLEEADEKTCYNCKWRWGDMCYAIRGVRLRLYDPVHPTTCKSWRASDATRRK